MRLQQREASESIASANQLTDRKLRFLSRESASVPEVFVGRSNILNALEEKLQALQNCNLIGEPRIGKTSLLYQLYNRRQRQQGLYVWVRLSELAEHHSRAFWQFLLQRLHNEAGVEVDSEQIAKTDSSLWEIYTEFMTALAHLIDNQRVIFLIDEFDLLQKGISVDDFNWLRSLVTKHRGRVGIVISSTDPLGTLYLTISEESKEASPLANVFHDYQLGLLTHQEAEDIINAAAQNEGVKLSTCTEDGDIGFLLKEAGRHPDLLKVACGYLFRAKKTQDAPDYQEIRGDLYNDSHTQWLCQRLFERRMKEPEEWDILQALAEDKWDTNVGDPIALRRLDRIGLVEYRRGQPALFADAFKYHLGKWLKRQAQTPPAQIQTPPTQKEEQLLSLLYWPDQRRIQIGDREHILTPLENRLLQFLAEHPEQICATEYLLANVWGSGKSVAVVEKAINRLRKKVEPEQRRPRYITSAWGEGYILRNVIVR